MNTHSAPRMIYRGSEVHFGEERIPPSEAVDYGVTAPHSRKCRIQHQQQIQLIFIFNTMYIDTSIYELWCQFSVPVFAEINIVKSFKATF